MSGESSGTGFRPHYTWLSAGLQLWHVHPEAFAANSFNPYSKGRFSGIAASPPREMYYAGTTPECALWEVTLRDIVPDGSVVSIDPALYTGYLISRVRLKRDIRVLDLRPPNIRHLSESREQWDTWQHLTVASEKKYPLTHAAAAEFLEAAPDAAGLLWHSRQCGRETTSVFYKGPMSSADFDVLEEIPLNSAKGLALIDSALAIANVKRADVGSLAVSVEQEEHPTDQDDLSR